MSKVDKKNLSPWLDWCRTYLQECLILHIKLIQENRWRSSPQQWYEWKYWCLLCLNLTNQKPKLLPKTKNHGSCWAALEIHQLCIFYIILRQYLINLPPCLLLFIHNIIKSFKLYTEPPVMKWESLIPTSHI